jgi:hypothetical protein
MNERHRKRLRSQYVRYYHEGRRHLGLGKGTPNCRTRVTAAGRAFSDERLGGLHHRYDRAARAKHRAPRLHAPTASSYMHILHPGIGHDRFLVDFTRRNLIVLNPSHAILGAHEILSRGRIALYP